MDSCQGLTGDRQNGIQAAKNSAIKHHFAHVRVDIHFGEMQAQSGQILVVIQRLHLLEVRDCSGDDGVGRRIQRFRQEGEDRSSV